MYYIIEHDIRPDGVVNVSETGRTTFANALSFFFERGSKGVVNEQFTEVHLILVDEKLDVVKKEHLKGGYVEPTTEESEGEE